MIHLSGADDTAEGRVATNLKEALLEVWPDLGDAEDDVVHIAANSKLYGYEVGDLDVLLCAAFTRPRLFSPIRPVTTAPSGRGQRREILVRSFIATVEVKSHDQRGIRFEGPKALVRYTRGATTGWHDASAQSLKQAHSMRAYLQDSGVGGGYVANLVLFDSLEEADLPRRPHNFLAGRIHGRQLLTALCEVEKPWWPEGAAAAVLSCGKSGIAERVLTLPIFRALEPSPLDRRRMDRIAKRRDLNPAWYAELGQKQLILRGRGGTGKTVALLQLANYQFEKNGARTLILTYNLALAADMRRIMALVRIPTTIEDGGVRVESVMAYVGRLLRLFGVVLEDSDFLSDYPRMCKDLADGFRRGHFSSREIAELLEEDAERCSYDLVMVDEAQDWPADEITILRGCYSANRFVVADGIDQLVRGARAAWTAGVPASEQKTWTLDTCLRLKSNLAHFANSLAVELQLDGWRVQPHDQVRGGRVIVVDKDLGDWGDLHLKLLQENKAAGNEPIDVLYCVPPSLAISRGEFAASAAAQWLKSAGVECWDGVRQEVRRDVPRSVSEARIVQYESCRGLEGWTVFCLGFDEFFENRLRIAATEYSAEMQSTISLEHYSQHEAARWAMIPMTRAMDTLVIQLGQNQSLLKQALKRASKRIPDVVQWTA